MENNAGERNSNYTNISGKISHHWRDSYFFQILKVEWLKAQAIWTLKTSTENALFLRRRWHGPSSYCRRAILISDFPIPARGTAPYNVNTQQELEVDEMVVLINGYQQTARVDVDYHTSD